MILQSHNSWSFLKAKKWWLRPFEFMARCQRKDLTEQYYQYNVRSFDLRIKFNKKGDLIVAHGFMQYDITFNELMVDLLFINSLNCSVRILHEVRNKKNYTEENVKKFQDLCKGLEEKFPNIKFFCGRNLYNWEVDYDFKYKPTEDEKYSSVCSPKLIDDWFPWIYAKLHNKENLEKGTDKDILSIDFVDIR